VAPTCSLLDEQLQSISNRLKKKEIEVERLRKEKLEKEEVLSYLRKGII
jgi:hypothetical protein